MMGTNDQTAKADAGKLQLCSRMTEKMLVVTNVINLVVFVYFIMEEL